MRKGGLIMNIEGQAIVNITSYHAENLINYDHSGCAFILSENAKVTVKDIYIKNLKGNGKQAGLFYTSQDSKKIEFNAYNVTLYDLYQTDKHETSIIYIERSNNVTIDGLKLFNSGGYNTNFINLMEYSSVVFLNFEIDNFESKTAREFVNYESVLNYYNELGIIRKNNI